MTYESWSCDLPARLPKRSYLYHLRPLGVGTQLVESLTGYVCRLAAAHCVSASVLVTREILPHIREESEGRAGAKGSTFIYDSYILNGIGDCPRAWTRVLQALTGESALHVMTMLPWARVISHRHLLRQNRAWCPRCFDSWRSADLPLYEPLLWSMQAVAACPLHACRLEERCPHCGKASKALTARALPGCCYHCCGWLGAPSLYPSRAGAPDIDLKLAHSVGDLLVRTAPLTEAVSPDCFKNNFRRCVDDFAAGNYSHFARLSGLTFDSVVSWLAPGSSFSFDSFLRMCCRLELSAARLMLEDIAPDDPDWVHARRLAHQNRSCTAQRKIHSGYRRPTRSESSVAAKRSRALLRRQFRRALATETPQALQAIALDMGFRYSSSLYHRFPDLCHALVQKNRRWRQLEDDKIRDTLAKAAEETPPPSMKEVAAQLGHSVNALRCRFPELSAALAARLPERNYLEKERLRVRLEIALQTDPPASRKDVAESIGRTDGHLRSLFPELCRQISGRYFEAKKRAAVQTRLRFCAEIRNAVLDLCERGIHPSRKRVLAAIVEPSMRCTHTLDAQIAKTVRELAASRVLPCP